MATTFRRFIRESEAPSMAEIRDRLVRECGEFMAQAHGLPAYRGINGVDDPWGQELHPHPSGRPPLSSSLGFVMMFNTMAELGTGEKEMRSHTMFMTGSARNARAYGKLYYVFPKGDIEFIWSPQIRDSYINDTSTYAEVADSVSRSLEAAGAKALIQPSTIEIFFQTMNTRHGGNWMSHADVEENCRTLFIEASDAKLRIPSAVKLFPIIRAALHKTFDLHYRSTGLPAALESFSEILVYKSEGYYALPISSVVKAWAIHNGRNDLDDDDIEHWARDVDRVTDAYEWFIKLGEK